MNDYNEWDFLNQFMNSLKPEYLIIVEGKKDIKSLEGLGLENELYGFNKVKRTLQDKIEEITKTGKDVVILTDFDNKGTELYNIINDALAQANVKVINEPRELLKQTRVSHIEGLRTRYENLKEKLLLE